VDLSNAIAENVFAQWSGLFPNREFAITKLLNLNAKIMATKKDKTQAELLEQFRVSLENLSKQTQISNVMLEFGFGPEERTQGKEIYQKARTAFDANKTEEDETTAAYSKFVTLKEELDKLYSTQRKKAKVVFRNDPVSMERLGVTGILARSYVKWFETVKKYFAVASIDSNIQNKLKRLKVSPEEINQGLALITEVESARAFYLKEKGEDQVATHVKDEAFDEIYDWMSEFYAIAKIAFEDNPQMLESLGKVVLN
jgi:hypothetical protein